MHLVNTSLVLLLAVSWGSALTVYRSQELTDLEDQGPSRPRPQRGEESVLGTHAQRNPYLEDPGQGHTPPAYFTNIHEEGGHTLGYTSFVSHDGNKEGNQDGSMEIKKIVPKSTVQVEMFHNGYDQQQQHQPQQQQQQTLSTQAQPQTHTIKPRQNKHKYKPPKNSYHDTLSKYKKARRVPYTSTTNSLDTSTPSYAIVAAGPKKYKTTPSPQTKKPFGQDETFQTFQPFQVAGDSQNKPRWKPLSDGVEIASSDEFKPKAKTRYPKEVSGALFSTQGEYLNGPEQFKAERFDHEKALKGSTAFSFSNAMTYGASPEPKNPNEEVRQTTLTGGSAFHIAHSQDIAKAVEAQLLGQAKGPIQFETGPALNLPKRNAVHAGGLNIPVMTEEEFERHFGKLSLEAYKFQEQQEQQQQQQKQQPQQQQQPKYKNNRHPFDSRGKREYTRPQRIRQQHSGQKQPKVQTQGQAQSQQAHSFSQMSSGSQIFAAAQSQQNPQYQPFLPQQYSSGNVDLFPSLSFTVPQAKSNGSPNTDRDSRFLAEEASEPQQYSVSASYQVDRGIGQQ